MHVLDLSALPEAHALGYPRALLFGWPLSRNFVRRTRLGLPGPDEFLPGEERVEALADQLAERLRAAGYRARSQSERQNLACGLGEGGCVDPAMRCGPSAVPQKTLARMAGLGVVGKNNLLVTRRWGCALVLCSVLTDAPLAPDPPADPPRIACGSCRACVDACPAGALSGRAWTTDGSRNWLLDRSKCSCALVCMMACPWTARYAGQADK